MKSKSKMIKVIVWSLLTIALVLLPSLQRVRAQTATFVVNSTADTVDAHPGDGVCADSSGKCTLRAAIMEANALPGADTIILPAGTYTLTIPGVNEDFDATGDLDITSDLTITGAGANITTIDGGGIDRVLDICPVNTPNVHISGLTVRGGTTLSSSPDDRSGGGVRNDGTLTLTNVTVRGNTADLGGGIFNDVAGALTINSSTISDNAATFNLGGGGGIFSISKGAALTLNSSTISGNTTPYGGGGIWIYHGTLILNNSTVSGNVAKYGGGIITSNNSIIVKLTNSTISGNSSSNSAAFRTGENANTILKNTIVAGNPGGDCEISVTNNVVNSLGHNLDSDGTCKLVHPTDLPNRQNPLLGPLANNGGPTLTHALLPGSPAIDAGGLDCSPTDQRGVPRPQGAACDIGAYEVGAACTSPPPNMVAWWPLDETSGTTVTDIVGAHNGTAQPAPIGAFAGLGPVTSAFWPPPTFQPGMVGTSLFFYGNRRIEVPSATDLEPGTGDFTIDAWVIYAASGSGQLLTVAQKNTGATAAFGNTLDGWRFVIRDSSPTQGLVSFRGSLSVGGSVEEPITPNAWHHVSATLSTTNGFRIVKVYVDGVSSSQIGLNGDIASTAPLLIGGDGIDAGQIAVDELEIFSRALTQPEIQAIFNAGSAGKCKGCATPPANMVGWWPADGNANDITPNPDNGTLNGGATFAPGMVAQAFSLNGTTAYVSAQTANKINFGKGDFSIDAWIKTTNANGVQIIVDKRVGKNGTTFTGYSLFTFNGNLAVQLADGTFLNFISTTNVADDRPHHVAVTIVRKSLTGGNLYVDGMPIFNFNPTGHLNSLDNSAELRIGRHSPNTVLDTFFKGLIDEVELFNRALSTTEVQSIFLAGSRGKCKSKCTIICPANITKANDPNQCGAVVTYPDPIASQVCGTATCSPPSTSFFPVGTTTVNCSTSAGSSCTFTVTVNDTQPPTISASGVIVGIGGGFLCPRVHFGVTASDNCPGVTKTCSPASGSCFPIGTTTVTCTATDSSGNTATTSFTVKIPDPNDPR